MTIRTRFTLLFALIVGVIVLIFSFAIYYLSEDYRRHDFELRLRDGAIARLKLLIVSNMDAGGLRPGDVLERDPRSPANGTLVVLDTNGQVLYRDSTAALPPPTDLDAIRSGEPHYRTTGGLESLGFRYTYMGRTYLLVASAHDEHGNGYIAHLKRILSVRGLLMLLVIPLCGWLYAGRFLKPINRIVQQVDRITSSNLNLRLDAAVTSDEVGRLTTTFNHMLERLETSFRVQKRFVSNASHELRTPLTAVSGQIDVALMKERDREEYERILRSIASEIRNMRVLSDNLLELANSEAETALQDVEDVRIDEVLWSIRDELAVKDPTCTVHIHFDPVIDNERFVTCKGRGRLLRSAFHNLIDNACKFSPDRTVDIRVIPEPGTITITFTDKGIGMSEKFIAHAFEPFSRGDNTHGIPGNGIGLSLVQRIIKLHSGKISLRSTINVGTTVRIVLSNQG